jgi:radical SAM protein with 4Fe4S-binding SPASM domain
MDTPGLQLLAVNLTKRCNLGCAHCYLDASTQKNGVPGEMTTEEVCAVLDEVAQLDYGTMIVLTGGEPLMRPDLEDIISHGAGLNLPMVVGTNGMMLTDQRTQSLKEAGVLGLGISVDSLDPDLHDRFRGMSGAWAKTMAGIDACKRHGLTFQIHFSITKDNSHELSGMISFALASGAKVLNIFFLVCTGRGESVSDISPERYEEVLNELIDAQKCHPDLIIRPRCAPHFKRIAYQRDPESPLNRISGQEGDGCIAGTHYCRITPKGGITACPYIPTEAGNIRKQSFTEVWSEAAELQRFRKPALKGACGECEFRKLCGGCRARPLGMGGDLMDTDPWCGYSPQGQAVIEPLQSLSDQISWSDEATTRLNRIPSMLRRMVKKRAEAYVAELGESQVTPEHLAVLSARRFGKGRPKKPFA